MWDDRMLVSRLYDLFNENISAQERVTFSGCPRGEGIWDILGYYDPKSFLITICEPEIHKYSKKLAFRLKYDEMRTILILRELVRLHEHVHALLHKGSF